MTTCSGPCVSFRYEYTCFQEGTRAPTLHQRLESCDLENGENTFFELNRTFSILRPDHLEYGKYCFDSGELVLILMRTKLAHKSPLARNPIDDCIIALGLKSQPTWQLALELSALKKKLGYVENEIGVLGVKKSSGNAIKSRVSINEKISAIEKELTTRKELK